MVFSIIRVVAMFMVGWPSLEWIDLSTCSFYVACLNFLGICVYLAAALAPAAAFVAQLAGCIFDACARCCGVGVLSPAALVAKLLSGSMTDAMVRGLFDQENESVQVSNSRRGELSVALNSGERGPLSTPPYVALPTLRRPTVPRAAQHPPNLRSRGRAPRPT